MADLWLGRRGFSRAERTAAGTRLDDREVRALGFELRPYLEDRMAQRRLATFLDASSEDSPRELLERLADRIRAGRIVVEQPANPDVDPDAGMAARTLTSMSLSDDRRGGCSSSSATSATTSRRAF
jgi:hypothetical protein